jgi:hypothetical protein
MSLTLTDLFDRLKQWDEVELLDILGITSEEIVERFSDIIEDRFETLEKTLTWEDNDD